MITQITLTSNTMAKMEDGYIAVDVPGVLKFFLNAINQGVLKDWITALNDVIKVNRVQLRNWQILRPAPPSISFVGLENCGLHFTFFSTQEIQYQYAAYQYQTAAAQAQGSFVQHPTGALPYSYGPTPNPVSSSHMNLQVPSLSPPPSPAVTANSPKAESPVQVPPLPVHIRNKRNSRTGATDVLDSEAKPAAASDSSPNADRRSNSFDKESKESLSKSAEQVVDDEDATTKPPGTTWIPQEYIPMILTWMFQP